MKKLITALIFVLATSFFGAAGVCYAGESDDNAPTLFEEQLHKQLHIQKTQFDVVAFLYSIYTGDIESLNEQLLKGADPNATFTGAPVAFFALHNDKALVLDTLIKNGADVESEYRGYSLLNYAILRKKADCVDVLIKNGADVRKESNGIVPLNFAIAKKNPDVVELLINAGARPNLKALDAAKKSKDENIKSLVLNATRTR